MRKTIVFSALSALILGSGLIHAAPAKSAAGSIVIVFKDGHRQSFNLADIERIEFPGAAVIPSAGANEPPRGRYVGKWEVGDGAGNNFTITLSEDGDAFRTLGDVHGHWNYANGDALITWDDGAQDAIRRTGSHYQKFAYSAGKSFTDKPDNVTPAHNVTPKPI
ncbi:MAG TPA: hypothetical protein VMD29_13425 [Terracidiphilus sp.]|nr:hypothetical protein [Terracidiphilus sp.]